MKIYITGSERVSECHLKVHETNLNALFSYYHISLIRVFLSGTVQECERTADIWLCLQLNIACQ